MNATRKDANKRYREKLKKDPERLAYHKRKAREWYEKNKDILKYRLANRRASQRYYRLHRKERLQFARERNEALKREAFFHYGKFPFKCECCDEKIFAFLTLDHLSEEARKRDGKKTGVKLYAWLRKNNWPAGLQILCFNCNSAKGFYGKCPHELQFNLYS